MQERDRTKRKYENVLLMAATVLAFVLLGQSFAGSPEFASAERLVDEGSYREAIPHLERSLAGEHNRTLAHVLRAQAYNSLRKFAKAIDDCNAAIVLNPFEPHSFTLRAFAFMGLGRFVEAINDCDQAIAIDPYLQQAYEYRAEAYRRLGKPELSMRDAHRAKELLEKKVSRPL